MATQKEGFKNQVEQGESIVYSMENVNLEVMRKEGDVELADSIEAALHHVGIATDLAGIKDEGDEEGEGDGQ